MNFDLEDFQFEWTLKREEIIKEKLAKEKADREAAELINKKSN